MLGKASTGTARAAIWGGRGNNIRDRECVLVNGILNWVAELSELEQLFFAALVLGVAIFLLRILMGLFTGANDVDGADEIPTSGDAGLASFRLLSLQGISAFSIMFGLVGLALYRQEGLPGAVSVFGGVAAGLATVWIIGRLLVRLGQLESDGTVKISRAIGEVGTVYLTIRPGGVGKVQVIVQQSLRIYDAISYAQEPLPTGSRVRVVDVVEGNVLVVEPYSAQEREAI